MKKPTLADVAKAAGVSLGTASRVINESGYASSQSKNAVRAAMQELGYEPKRKPVIASGGQTLALIIKRLPHNLFFESMNYAFLEEADRHGMHAISVFCEHMDNETVGAEVKKLEGYNICGICIIGFEGPKLSGQLRSLLLNCGHPVVFVERLADSFGFNQIYIDNFLGGYLGAKHLIDNGHKKIVYVGRKAIDADAGSRRLDGFMKAINESENTLQYLIKLCSTPESQEGYRAMQEAQEELPGFTAVQFWFDGYAIGAMQYFYEHHIRIPEDVELIGHDNTYSQLLSPPISSIRLPFEEIAEQAVSIILDWQDGASRHFVKRINLEPKLVLRP